MAYILQYFERVAGDIYNNYIDDSENIHNHCIKARTEKEANTLLEYLRSIYYSEKSQQEITVLFTKLLRRLGTIKKSLEDAVIDLPKGILTFSPNDILKYENCKDAYLAVANIIEVFVNEFDIKVDNQEEVSFYSADIDRSKSELNDARKQIFEAFDNDTPIPESIIEEFGLDPKMLYACKNSYYRNELDKLKQINEIYYPSNDDAFKCLVKNYIIRYIVSGDTYEYYFYKNIFRYLKAESQEIEEDKKIKFVVAFFIHTSLCQDLVLDFFEAELGELDYYENIESVRDYLQSTSDWLNEIASTPKYRQFRIRRPEGVVDNTCDRVNELIEQYKSDYRVNENGNSLNGNEGIKKLIWKGHPKTFVEALSPLVESKGLFIDDNTDRDKIVEALFDKFIVISKKTKKPLVLDSLITYFKKYPNGEPY